jgi:hypothetical protein
MGQIQQAGLGDFAAPDLADVSDPDGQALHPHPAGGWERGHIFGDGQIFGKIKDRRGLYL